MVLKSDYVFERSSGYPGFRNIKTGDWLHLIEYERLTQHQIFDGDERVIQFDTALLAFENDFKLRTVGSHHYKYYQFDGRIEYPSNGHLYLDNPAAVPQSVLEKWLRDMHHVYVSVTPFYIEGNTVLKHVVVIRSIHLNKRYSHQIEGDYEDSLEWGLKKGLNWIKSDI